MTSSRHRSTLRAIVFCTTLFRVICAVAIVALAVLGHWAVLLPVALAAFVSDFLDGWLARRWQVVSSFGMAFDPLADKVVCLTILAVAAVYVQPWYWLLFAVFAAYDTITMTMRFVMARPMPASKTAKLKTALLMTGLVAVIAGVYSDIVAWAAVVLLVAAAVLTLRSLGGYIRALVDTMDWLAFAPGVTAIDFTAWHAQGVRAILFDVDGTVTPWASPDVDASVRQAVQRARKAGIRHIGLVSNMPTRDVERAKAIAAQVDADAYRIPARRAERKPSSAMVRAILRELGAKPAQTAFVGDKMYDVLAARRAGIPRVVWVERLGTADHPLDKALYRPVERLVKRFMM